MKKNIPGWRSVIMKNPPRTVALNRLVNELIKEVSSVAVAKKNILVNDICRELSVTTNEEVLADALKSMLHSIVVHTADDCIRISAKLYGNIVLLHIRDIDTCHREVIAGELMDIEPLAEKIGGCITLNNHTRISTVALSFYNHPVAC